MNEIMQNLNPEDYQQLGQALIMIMNVKGFRIESNNVIEPKIVEVTQMEEKEQKWYTTDEMVDMLGKSAHTIRRQAKTHDIQVNRMIKPHRYLKKDVDKVFGLGIVK